MSKAKKCTKCKQVKGIDEFHKHKACKDGINTQCKVCVNLATKLYKANNHEKIRKQNEEYRKLNAEIISKKSKKRYEENKDVILIKRKIYRENNKEEIAERNRRYRENNAEKIVENRKIYDKNNADKIKEYREKNKDKISRQHAEYIMRRYNEDIGFKIAHLLRSRLRLAIKRNQKVGSAVRDLGCSVEELKQHLEEQFVDGMTWENYGFYGWHIDHIIPLASFDLTDREQFLKACHYTNLQPLWAKDNLRKGAKV